MSNDHAAPNPAVSALRATAARRSDGLAGAQLFPSSRSRRARNWLPSALLALGLGGCAGLTTGGPPWKPRGSVSYECHDLSATGSGSVLPIYVTAQGGQLSLQFARDRGERLAAVAGSPGLYANAAHAWRITRTGAVLTDIARVSTFSCLRPGSLG